MAEILVATLERYRRQTRTYDQDKDNIPDILDAINAILPPTGSFMPTAATTAPNDAWAICDGSALVKADFPALHAILGSTFGDTATTFNLPDLRGRALIGQDGGPIGSLYDLVGAQQVTLTTSEMPAHSHTVTDPGHSHGVTDPGHDHTAADENVNTVGVGAATEDGAIEGSTSTDTTGITIDTATTGITIASTGSGQPFDIIPPAMAVNWMIRT